MHMHNFISEKKTCLVSRKFLGRMDAWVKAISLPPTPTSDDSKLKLNK